MRESGPFETACYILEIRLVETVLELVYYTEWQRKYLNSYVLSSAVDRQDLRLTWI